MSGMCQFHVAEKKFHVAEKVHFPDGLRHFYVRETKTMAQTTYLSING